MTGRKAHQANKQHFWSQMKGGNDPEKYKRKHHYGHEHETLKEPTPPQPTLEEGKGEQKPPTSKN